MAVLKAIPSSRRDQRAGKGPGPRPLALGMQGLILAGLIGTHSGLAVSRTSPEAAGEPPPAPAAADDWGFYSPDIYIDEIRGRLRVSPFITTGVSYSTNENFEAESQPDFVYFIQPGVSIDFDAGRFQTEIDFSVVAEYSTSEDGFEIREAANSRLLSTNTIEVVENTFFVDAQAAITRELFDARDRPSASDIERSDDRVTVQRYRASPYVRYRIGRFAENETRIGLSYVGFGRHAGDDSIVYSASTNFTSGRMFNRFQWQAASRYSVSNPGDDDNRFETLTNQINTSLALNRRVALLANVGHDRIEDADVEDVPDGVFWNVGFNVRPNPRLDATVTYGRRYENDDISLNVDYQVSPGATFTARFEQTLDTREELILRDLTFLGVDTEGRLIDTRTGEPLTSTADLFGLRAELFRRNRFDTQLALSRGRNGYVLGGFYETRETFESPVETSRGYGARATWRRQLNRRTDGRLRLEYQHVDFGTTEERVDDLYTVRTSLSHNLGEGLSMFFGYVFQHQDSTVEDRTATENLVTLSLTKRF